MFYPNTVWNSGNLVLDSAAQKARKFVVARGLSIKSAVIEKSVRASEIEKTCPCFLRDGTMLGIRVRYTVGLIQVQP